MSEEMQNPNAGTEQLHRVVGIDLGTTYSAVATFNTYSEQAEVMLNRAEGDAATCPSVVSLDPATRKAIVGQTAKQNLLSPQNTIIEIKREMGEDFRPETLEKYHAQNIFNEGDPVKAHFVGQWLLPQEISAFILMKMKQIAELEIKEEIRDAVVTVPAYFTEKQKKATQEAALLAGLYPRQLIPEPTAAAICYGVDRFEEERKVYLVFDLGGGTFDVSIIEVFEENINVIATSGDPRLGGGDFDDAITGWAIEQLRLNYQVDVAADPVARARIKRLAEQAKIRLGTHTSTTLALGEIDPQKSPALTLTRDTFESLIERILRKSLTFVETAITNAEKKDVKRDNIDAILLVGGSTKIPKVKDMLLDYFEKDPDFVRADLNPDEVVARGAAIMAYRFGPSPPPFEITSQGDQTLVNPEAVEAPDVRLITEHSLGVEVQDKLFSKIVDQGCNIPLEVAQGGFTNGGPTNDIEVRVFQGEGSYVYENTLIGTLHLGPITPQPAGVHQFEVTFKLDVNGLLSMTVNHLNEGKRYEARFDHKTGVGGNEALVRMRNKLLQLYGGSDAQLQPEAAAPPAAQPSQPVAAPPPPPSGQAQQSGVPSQQAPTQTAQPAERPDPAAPAPRQPGDAAAAGRAEEPAVGVASQDGPAAPPMPTAAASEAIPEPSLEVPGQFKSIVRRTRKQLFRQQNASLLEALKAFITALNSGASEVELENLGDELEDVYHDARNP